LQQSRELVAPTIAACSIVLRFKRALTTIEEIQANSNPAGIAMAERVLIVDDDPVQRRLLQNMVEKAGYQVATAESGEAALALMTAFDGPHFECIVLDLVMPDLDGLGVLGRMREAGIAIPVIVQTAHGGLDVVVSAMRAGAIDFAVKPVGAERLLVSLRNAVVARALEGELARMKRSRGGTLSFKDIVTRSAKMRAVLQAAQKSAGSTIPVLVEGESGVGKELIARAIHGSGARKGKPFVAVNCGALPENLIESILFGHEKGAFTGATERHEGKFQEASGGTLFLDEVGELPPLAQVKLLRALQEGEVEPVGGKRPVQVNVRVISATNRDLLADVKSGRFREDLFYRLHVFPIHVPPLRERAEDIPDLTRHFMVRFAAEEGKRVRSMSAEALCLLSAYFWPGNVRQLENAIFRAVVLAEGEEIGLDEFPHIANPGERTCSASLPVASATDPEPSPPLAPGIVIADEAAISSSASGQGVWLPEHLVNLVDDAGHARPLEEVEADAIRFALSHYRNQMSEVARRLRIGRSTLYRKLDGLGLAVVDGAGSRVALK
jgi:DNA-binding NtrC family response regulator